MIVCFNKITKKYSTVYIVKDTLTVGCVMDFGSLLTLAFLSQPQSGLLTPL